MTAAILAELLRALVPFAEANTGSPQALTAVATARRALRKAAPCEGCQGTGKVSAFFPADRQCRTCDGIGFTSASIDAAIERAEERTRLDEDIRKAAEDLVSTRNALDARRKAEPNQGNREPGVPFEVDAAVDYLGDVLTDSKILAERVPAREDSDTQAGGTKAPSGISAQEANAGLYTALASPPARTEILHVVREAAEGSAIGKTQAAIGKTQEEIESIVAQLIRHSIAKEREACAQIAESCSGGDHKISKRDLIASEIRKRNRG